MTRSHANRLSGEPTPLSPYAICRQPTTTKKRSDVAFRAEDSPINRVSTDIIESLGTPSEKLAFHHIDARDDLKLVLMSNRVLQDPRSRIQSSQPQFNSFAGSLNSLDKSSARLPPSSCSIDVRNHDDLELGLHCERCDHQSSTEPDRSQFDESSDLTERLDISSESLRLLPPHPSAQIDRDLILDLSRELHNHQSGKQNVSLMIS